MNENDTDRSCSDESSQMQIVDIVTDRAGILAVANLPILWLFAGRNDVFLWLTGWNFATYNSFHRWISRVVTVQVIIHSIGYTWIYLHGELICFYVFLELCKLTDNRLA